MPRSEAAPRSFAQRMHDIRGPFGSIISVCCDGPECEICAKAKAHENEPTSRPRAATEGMMHYLGLLFVDEPTQAAIDEALEGQKNHWDWYRPGGRWDGWLVGDDEMKARETHDGFNFDDANKRIEVNCCRVRDLPSDRLPYFFVAKWAWVAKEFFVDGYPHGRIIPNDTFASEYGKARDENPDKWAIVIDVHN